MSNLINRTLLAAQIPTLCFRRFRGKINIQHPRAPHYNRQIVLDLTEPKIVYKPRVKPCTVRVFAEKTKEVNPYEVILAREAKNWFDSSKMVAVLHVNPINSDDFFKARVLLHKNGIQLKKYGNSLLTKALEGTNFEVLLPLNRNKAFSTAFAFSTEHNKVGKLIASLKKVPQMHLLCGIVDGQLLSKNEFTDYAKLPSIDIARSQLVNVLNMAGSTIVQNLESHQINLVRILDAHVNHHQKSVEGDVENKKTSGEEK